ncbi:MAG: CrcB family protein [Oscillospiraceae bacterium]|nr:CrcB family protein [Oscillospiraceae bacterium]
MIIDFLFVGMGGFIGSCLRFALTKVTVYLGIEFPIGTLLSNVIAGSAIGFIIGLGVFSPRTKLFFVTGLLGGLSTFSAFSLETVNLFSDGRYLLCGLNVLLNLALSLSAVVLGMFLAGLILKKV